MRPAELPRRPLSRLLRRGPVAVAMAIIFSLVIGIGAAWAYLLATGSGTGSATIQSITVTAGTAGSPSTLLYPGGSGSLEVNLDPSVDLTIVNISTVGYLGADATCKVTVSTGNPGTVSVSATGSAHTVSIPGVVHMASTSPTSTTCDGATFAVTVKLTVRNA